MSSNTKRKSAPRKATFLPTEVKGERYFKPVNKRAKKGALAVNKRTRVTKADLKTIAKSYKVYIYVGAVSDGVLKSVRV